MEQFTLRCKSVVNRENRQDHKEFPNVFEISAVNPVFILFLRDLCIFVLFF